MSLAMRPNEVNTEVQYDCIPVWIIHIWLLHTWISRVWHFPFWRGLLRLFVYLKDCAAHPAFTVSLPVPDEVAVLFKLTERGENGIRTFLADCRKSLG